MRRHCSQIRRCDFERGVLRRRRGLREAPNLPRAKQVDHRQQRQHRGHTDHHGHAFGDERTAEAGQRADAGDSAEVVPGSVRVESLGRNQPEARSQHRAETRDLQVDEPRRQHRHRERQQPRAKQQDGAEREGDWHERRRRDLLQSTRAREHQQDRDHGRSDHDRRQRRHVEVGEIERVPRGFAGNELRAHGRRADHRDEDRRIGPGRGWRHQIRGTSFENDNRPLRCRGPTTAVEGWLRLVLIQRLRTTDGFRGTRVAAALEPQMQEELVHGITCLSADLARLRIHRLRAEARLRVPRLRAGRLSAVAADRLKRSV